MERFEIFDLSSPKSKPICCQRMWIFDIIKSQRPNPVFMVYSRLALFTVALLFLWACWSTAPIPQCKKNFMRLFILRIFNENLGAAMTNATPKSKFCATPKSDILCNTKIGHFVQHETPPFCASQNSTFFATKKRIWFLSWKNFRVLWNQRQNQTSCASQTPISGKTQEQRF